MDKRLFQEIILDYQKKGVQKLTIRDSEIPFIPFVANGIIGARRSGKTFRTHQIANEVKSSQKQNICRIQFNDHRLVKIKSTELHQIDQAYYSLFPEKREEEIVFFIFDEIHRIDGWEDYILYLLELETHRVVLTGSTAALQRGKYASQLRGKFLPTIQFPFSFSEFLKHYQIAEDVVSSSGKSFLRKYLLRYLKQGGFPGLLDIPKHLHEEMLRSYWDTMLLRDIIESHSEANININVLRYFADALISRIGCPMTTGKLASSMKILGFTFSTESLYKYLNYLLDAFMIYNVEFYSESERVRSRNYKKIYCIDWALAQAVSYGAGVDETRALENAVFIELQRRNYRVSYFVTKDGYEVDFVAVNSNAEIELIQVSFSISDDDVKKRELRSIINSYKFLKVDSAKIITFDEEGEEVIDNIRIEIIPAWKWLIASQT